MTDWLEVALLSSLFMVLYYAVRHILRRRREMADGTKKGGDANR